MTSVQGRNMQRLVDQINSIDPFDVVVLKTHLLLEEQLDRILAKFVFHPDCLEQARLGFAQKIDLARSLSLDEHANAMWALLRALNTLRNKLAHELEAEGRSRALERVKDLFFANYEGATEEQRPSTDMEVANFAVALVFGFLSGFEEEAIRFRDVVDGLDKILNPHRHSAKE